ncbi:MAG: YerC/YecD family TrpR-related protein [Defluviitaleaceae bacterium]|nr:YerC/YecD family TrpR-related protein [Defluviitaleaceae bacterium]
MNSKIKNENTDLLFSAILELKDMDECYAFFEDLCTVFEIKAMSQRIAVAKMLLEKKVYTEIVPKTGASTSIVSRVSRSLQYGCNSYDKLFRRMGIKIDGNTGAEDKT